MTADEEASHKDTHDELSLLPAKKRRKLQQLNRSRKRVELVRQMATFIWPQSANPCFCCSCWRHSQVSWLHLCADALAHGHLLPLTCFANPKNMLAKMLSECCRLTLTMRTTMVMRMARKAYTLLASPTRRRLQSLTVIWILSTSHLSRGM